MGTLKEILEAKSSKEISGYIDMEDPQTKLTPENPAIVVIGLGKLDYETLKKDVDSASYESPFQAYIRTLIQVEEKMASGPYKRKLTLAKRKR
jgi:hypothetical protein